MVLQLIKKFKKLNNRNLNCLNPSDQNTCTYGCNFSWSITNENCATIFLCLSLLNIQHVRKLSLLLLGDMLAYMSPFRGLFYNSSSVIKTHFKVDNEAPQTGVFKND